MPAGYSVSTLVVKLAAPCNLNCSYCYVYQHEDRSFLNRPALMSEEVFHRTLIAARDYCDRRPGHKLSIAFHGGEPTLIGVERFDAIAASARSILGRRLSGLYIQTNSTRIDSHWVETFRRRRVRVGVSLDGPQAVNDQFRVNHSGTGSHRAAVRGIRILQRGEIRPSVLTVIHPGVSGLRVYRHLRRLGVTTMAFLLPDVTHDSKHRWYGQLEGTPVADYLVPIFDAWFDEDNPRIEIRIFADLLHLMFGHPARRDQFGSPQVDYLVIETDGSIEGLDALRSCAEGISKTGLNVLTHSFEDIAFGSPLVYRAMTTGFPLPDACHECPERDVCRGGFLPNRYSKMNGFNNRSVWCADIMKLLRHMRERTGIEATRVTAAMQTAAANSR